MSDPSPTARPPKPVRFDAETVTFRRADFDAFMDMVEDLEDRAATDRALARERELGPEEYRRLCYTAAEIGRMLDEGVAALTVWRERAGLTQRALAEAAGVSPSYLAEIERGKKPGSAAALNKLAQVLRVPMDYLMTGNVAVAARGEPEAA